MAVRLKWTREPKGEGHHILLGKRGQHRFDVIDGHIEVPDEIFRQYEPELASRGFERTS